MVSRGLPPSSSRVHEAEIDFKLVTDTLTLKEEKKLMQAWNESEIQALYGALPHRGKSSHVGNWGLTHWRVRTDPRTLGAPIPPSMAILDSRFITGK